MNTEVVISRALLEGVQWTCTTEQEDAEGIVNIKNNIEKAANGSSCFRASQNWSALSVIFCLRYTVCVNFITMTTMVTDTADRMTRAGTFQIEILSMPATCLESLSE